MYGRQSGSRTGFLMSVVFHQCSILIFNYVLRLPEGQTGETLEPQKSSADSEIEGNWVHKYFYCIYKGWICWA